MALQSVNFGSMGIDMSGQSSGAFGDAFSMLGLENDDSKNADFRRNESAQNNQLIRDLYFQERANAFNSMEAQKQRDFEERMSSSAYSRAMEDMKKAGLNPILALGNPASTPSGASASSGGGRSSNHFSSKSGNGAVVGTLLSVLAGMYTAGAKNATALALAGLNNDSKEKVANNRDVTRVYRDRKWREWYDSKRK